MRRRVREPREVLGRLLVAAAPEGHLGALDVDEHALAAEEPAALLGQQPLGIVPVAELGEQLGDRDVEPDAVVAAPRRLVARGAGDLERLAVAAGEVQRVGEVDLRALELTRAPLVAGDLDRAAQRGGALLDRALRGERDAHAVERARERRVVAGRLGVLDGVAGGDDGVAVAALEHPCLGEPGVDRRALGRRVAVRDEGERVACGVERLRGTPGAPVGHGEALEQGGGAARLDSSSTISSAARSRPVGRCGRPRR